MPPIVSGRILSGIATQYISYPYSKGSHFVHNLVAIAYNGWVHFVFIDVATTFLSRITSVSGDSLTHVSTASPTASDTRSGHDPWVQMKYHLMALCIPIHNLRLCKTLP